MQVNNQPLFDYGSLESELDEECTADLAKSFVEDTAPILANLADAIKNKQQDAVRSNAHKLKGCSRSINCQQLEHESSVVEDAAISGDWATVESRYNTLEPIYKALCEEIAKYLNKG